MSGLLKRGWLLLVGALMLAACGGSGGGDSGSDGGTPPPPAIAVAVQIVDGNGAATNNVTPNAPGVVKATVTNKGAGVPNVVVTYKTSIGVLDPVTGTALTDAQGVAKITLKAGDVAGAGTVTAEAAVSGVTATGSAAFSTSIPANNVTMALVGPTQPLSAGATTTLVATLSNSNGTPFNDIIPVTFTSGCIATGRAVINSPVNTVRGVASSTYRAAGCVGEDVVTVSATVGSNVLSKTVSVNVQPASLGSIEFVSATPQTIALKGTGDGVRPETSIVKFRVLDAQGNPVNAQKVNFRLNTTVGGLSVSPNDPANPSDRSMGVANTDSAGVVQVTVLSGAIATSVRVTAFIETSGQTLSAQSSNLVVTTGLADQDSISLAATVLNPEAWSVDGTEVGITARLADAFNNPAPDGTTVQFQTEGGSIGGDCKTLNGVCSVKWISQNPRPGKGQGGCAKAPSLVKAACGQPYSGRTTVLATAVGNESFNDLNGNGLFDADSSGKVDAAGKSIDEVAAHRTGKDNSGDDFDLAEAFLDHNEDGSYQGGVVGSTNETFLDFNFNGFFDTKNQKYDGVLCGVGGQLVRQDPSGNCGTRTLHVRQSLTLVMSDSAVVNRFQSGCAADEPALDTLSIKVETSGTACFVYSDLNNQPVPAGTKIEVKTSTGTVAEPSTFVVPSTNANHALSWGFAIKAGTKAESGFVTVLFTTPGGLVTVARLNLTITP